MTENTTEEVVEDVVEPGQETDPVATLTADYSVCRLSMQTIESV